MSPSDPSVPAAANRPAAPSRRPSLETAFDPRHNSLNFLRLVLATCVVFSHSLTLGSFGSENFLDKTTLGTAAVYGFFGLSGFLIARSASRTRPARYLWQRFLRIFPGFWVCLLVTAAFFGVIGWFNLYSSAARECGLSCYVREPGGPVGYVLHNFWLQINQPTIANTLHPGIFRDVWNGSLWTLEFEFLCYLLIGVIAVVGLLKRPKTVLVLAAAVWITEIVLTSVPTLNAMFTPGQNWYLMKMITFVPIFLSGSLLYLYRDKIPDSGWLAALCAAIALFGLVLPLGAGVPTFRFTSPDLTAVFLAYPLLWLGIHLPLHKVGARNDYSYGVYVYAFPVQQLLVLWGVSQWGYWPFSIVAVLAVLPFAIGSWWVVEKQALKLKRMQIRPVRSPVPAAAPSNQGYESSGDPALSARFSAQPVERVDGRAPSDSPSWTSRPAP